MTIGTATGSWATAETMDLDADLRVDYDPATLTLEPGETGEVLFGFFNKGNDPLPVGLEFAAIKVPGGSRARFSSSYFTLEPGHTTEVTCSITSNARYGQGGDVSDVHIIVMWGQGLRGIDEGGFNSSNASRAVIVVEVMDDFSRINMALSIAILVVASTFTVTIIVWRRRSSNRVSTEEGTAGHQDS